MPNNECIPWQEDADRLPAQASVAVTGKRFVTAVAAKLSGPLVPATAQVGASDPTDGGRIQAGPTALGQHPLGVASWDAAVGEGFDIIREGVVPVTAGAALTAGALVQADATGQAIPFNPGNTPAAGAALPTIQPCGIAVDAAALGADAQIALL